LIIGQASKVKMPAPIARVKAAQVDTPHKPQSIRGVWFHALFQDLLIKNSLFLFDFNLVIV
jgi:hypothetical protein